MPRRGRREEEPGGLEELVERKYQSVVYCIENYGDPDAIFGRFKERDIKEAVREVVSRLLAHGMDLDVFDWCEFTELSQFESTDDFIRDLEERGVLPPPPAEERVEEIIDRMIHDYKRELEQFGYKVLSEKEYRRLLRDARRAEELERHLEELNQKLKKMEEAIRRLMARPEEAEAVAEELAAEVGAELLPPPAFTWGEIKSDVVYNLMVTYDIPYTSASYVVKWMEHLLEERFEQVRHVERDEAVRWLAKVAHDALMSMGRVLDYGSLTALKVEIRNPRQVTKYTQVGPVTFTPPIDEVYSRILMWVSDLSRKQGFTVSVEPIETRFQSTLIVAPEYRPEDVRCLVVGQKIIACNAVAAGYNYFEAERRVIHCLYDRAKRL